jgi:hypothetical protein
VHVGQVVGIFQRDAVAFQRLLGYLLALGVVAQPLRKCIGGLLCSV